MRAPYDGKLQWYLEAQGNINLADMNGIKTNKNTTQHNTTKQNTPASVPNLVSEVPVIKKVFCGSAPLEVVVDPVVGDNARKVIMDKFGHLDKGGKGLGSRLYFNEKYESRTPYQEFLFRFFATMLYTGLISRETTLVYDFNSDIVGLSEIKDSLGNSVFDRTATTFNGDRADVSARHRDEIAYLRERGHKDWKTLGLGTVACEHCGSIEHPSCMFPLDNANSGRYPIYSSLFSFGLFDFETFLTRMLKTTTGYLALNDFHGARLKGRRSGLLMDGEGSFTFDGDDVILSLDTLPCPQRTRYMRIPARAWMIRRRTANVDDLWLCHVIESIDNGDVEAKFIKVTRVARPLDGLEILGMPDIYGIAPYVPQNSAPQAREINLDKPKLESEIFRSWIMDRFGKQDEGLTFEGETVILTIHERRFWSPFKVLERTYKAPVSMVVEALNEVFGRTSSSDVLRAQRTVARKSWNESKKDMQALTLTEQRTHAMVIALHFGGKQFATVQSYMNGSSYIKQAVDTLKGGVHDFRNKIDWSVVGKFLLGLFLVVLVLATAIVFTSKDTKVPPSPRLLTSTEDDITDDTPDRVDFVDCAWYFLMICLTYTGCVIMIVLFLKLMAWLRRNRVLAADARTLTSTCVTDCVRLDMAANTGRYPAN